MMDVYYHFLKCLSGILEGLKGNPAYFFSLINKLNNQEVKQV